MPRTIKPPEEPAKGISMAKLNLNFHKTTGCYEPTKSEIGQLEALTLSIKAIVQVMARYTVDHPSDEEAREVTNNCASVFIALESLMEPLVEYMTTYAGKEAAPESGEGENA